MSHRDLEIAPNLLYREMACKGSGIAVAHVTLLTAWTGLRHHLGETVRIMSGYRSEEHNAAVGGAPGSQHTQGRAMDLWWKSYAQRLREGPNGEPALTDEFFWMLLGFGFRGVGVSGGFLHVDTRRGPRVVWSYLPGGKRVPNIKNQIDLETWERLQVDV